MRGDRWKQCEATQTPSHGAIDRKWGKKVIFLVNKVDILARQEEVVEVADFVADNAQRLLGVEAAKVLPISARAALDAKLAHSNGSGGMHTKAAYTGICYVIISSGIANSRDADFETVQNARYHEAVLACESFVSTLLRGVQVWRHG